MADLTENNVIRFKNISRKKETMFANFKVSGVRAGVNISATIAVDFSAAQKDPCDKLEDIIEECARIGMRQFKNSDFQFEGISQI